MRQHLIEFLTVLGILWLVGGLLGISWIAAAMLIDWWRRHEAKPQSAIKVQLDAVDHASGPMEEIRKELQRLDQLSRGTANRDNMREQERQFARRIGVPGQ